MAGEADAVDSTAVRSRLAVVKPPQCIGEAEPALELLLGTLGGAEASADRLAVELQLELEPERAALAGIRLIRHEWTLSRASRWRPQGVHCTAP